MRRHRFRYASIYGSAARLRGLQGAVAAAPGVTGVAAFNAAFGHATAEAAAAAAAGIDDGEEEGYGLSLFEEPRGGRLLSELDGA